jgi:hypothetical protein
VEHNTIWQELSAPLPPFDELVKSYLAQQPKTEKHLAVFWNDLTKQIQEASHAAPEAA